MRTLMAGATFLLVGTGAAMVAAPALNGSDTLFEVTQDVIASCGTKFNGDGIEEPGAAAFSTFSVTYVGGGSGVGAAQMDSNVQHVSPMSRTLKTSEFCSTAGAGTAVQATSEAMEVGVDGIAIVANAASTCGNTGSLAGTANGVAITGQTFTFGSPAQTYTIRDSVDVLRLIFFGMDNTNAFDCNGAIRRALVANWGNLFSTSCAAGNAACPTGLRHAYRRSDLSGTTDAFVSLVGAGARAIGNNPFATGAQLSKKQNPFCNSIDANQPTPAFPACSASVQCPQNFACDPAGHCTYTNNAVPAGPCAPPPAANNCPAGFACDATGHCSLSDGGRSDFSDVDPIRVPCLTPTTTQRGFDEVCDVSGTLGLVLPIFTPDTAAVTASDMYPTVDCDPGACDLVAPARLTQLPLGYICPDGQTLTLNRCWAPFHADPAAPGGENFNCRADKRTNHCFGLPGGLATAEGRVYNKAIMKPATNLPGANAVDLNGRLMSGSFFRIRAGLNSRTPVATGGTNVDPSICNTQLDATGQIGCLTDADQCTIGFAGREAAPPTTFKALSVQGVGQTTALFPDDVHIANLVNGAAANDIYAIARRLYFATIYGFGSLTGGESQLASCYGDESIVKAADIKEHFLPVPGGVKCLDYDESNVTTAIIDPVDQLHSGKIPGNCGTTLNPGNTDVNACTNSPAPLGPTAQEVFNIMNNNPTRCANCHTGVGTTLPGSMDLTSLAAFKAATIGVTSVECGGKKRVNPGNSASSYLIDKLLGAAQDGGCFSGNRMPAGGAPLTPFQISQIAQWIDSGAAL